MKNSKGETLEQPYLDLAMMRREQQEGSEYRKTWDFDFEEKGFLLYAFDWDKTPEKIDWWYDLFIGNSPDIPSSSLADLEEWRKAKQEANKPETWGKQLYDSGQFHDLLTKYENAEPDYKAMYEEAVKERDYYRTLHER